MVKKNIAVLGSEGYVGRAVCTALEKKGEVPVRVTRANYEAMKNASYDVLINAAMPSKRFWAEQNPEQDFQETVQKTRDLILGWNFKKFVQISSVSARTQLDTVYGRHKAEAEKQCKPGALIARLTSMYSEDLSKGALMDILNKRKVFVSGKSRYSFTPLEFAAAWIAANLDRAGVIEIGAKNSVSLEEIAENLGEKIEFSGPVDIQEIQNPAPDFPDARDVLMFMKQMKSSSLREAFFATKQSRVSPEKRIRPSAENPRLPRPPKKQADSQ